MTLLVASLFLPHTVEFHLNNDAFNPELINSLPIKRKNETVKQTPPQSVNSGSILTKKVTAEDFKTANSSIEDFFYQSLSQSPVGATSSAPSTTSTQFSNEELKNKLTKIQSSGFVPKSRVVPNKGYQKSNLQYEDLDTVSVSEDEFEFSDDDGYDTLYNRRQRIPKFGGFSRKDLLSHDTDIYNNSTFNIIDFHKGNGALYNAVKSFSISHKWIGTIGIPTDDLPQATKEQITKELSSDYNCESVLPSDFTFQGHYKNYCKQILWPTLHYQVPDDPNSKAFEDHSWEFYKELNQQFADKIIEIYKPDDLIWIHDYHLLLVPEMIRLKLPNAKIGFYLHVSFPSSEVFKCFAQRESMLIGILGANYVSFQTDEYVRHFSQTCNKLLLADISKDEIRYKGSTIKISSSPVGIDSDQLLQQIHQSQEVSDWMKLIREKWPTQKLIVGRDKFDKIRGVKQKLLAYELFLIDNPEYLESTVLIQICLKSRNQNDVKLESEIISIVDRINSLSPNISTNTQPVVFLHQDIEFFQYLGLLCEADCFIVSSMREGMNLTCHEFIVATTNKKSPLILSEFTGSASVFNKGALKINPWDIKQVSIIIKKALDLNDDVKKINWEYLIKAVKNQDCYRWVNTNLIKIQSSWKLQIEKNKNHFLNIDKFKLNYNESKRKIFILHISSIPNERILKILRELTNVKYNEVYIFSHYKRLELERLYRALLPKIGLIGENGGLIKLVGESTWKSLVNITNFKEWLSILKDVLKSYEERIPESFIEIGETFIKFHTEENVEDPERKNSLIGDLITHINSIEYDDKNKFHATVSDGIIYLQHSNIVNLSIRYLIDYYLKKPLTKYDIKNVKPISLTSSLSQKNINQKIIDSNFSEDEFIKSDFLTIGGKSDVIFEPVFEYVNELMKINEIPIVYTIGYTEDDDFTTIAKEQVEGLNELFTVLAKL